MAKDLPSFIAQEGAKREGSVIREKNSIDANNYETVAYLKHLDVRNEPKMVLFENRAGTEWPKIRIPDVLQSLGNAPVRRRFPRYGRYQITDGSEPRSRQARTTTRQGRSHRAGKSAGQGSRPDRRQGRPPRAAHADASKRRRRPLSHDDLRNEGAQRRISTTLLSPRISFTTRST